MNAQQETERSRREWSNYREYLHLQGHGDHFDDADLRAMAKMKREAEERVNTSDPSVHQEGVGTSSDEAHGIKGAIT